MPFHSFKMFRTKSIDNNSKRSIKIIPDQFKSIGYEEIVFALIYAISISQVFVKMQAIAI